MEEMVRRVSRHLQTRMDIKREMFISTTGECNKIHNLHELLMLMNMQKGTQTFNSNTWLYDYVLAYLVAY